MSSPICIKAFKVFPTLLEMKCFCLFPTLANDVIASKTATEEAAGENAYHGHKAKHLESNDRVK